MKEQFKKYLINQGYRELTPSNRPSTVYDYCKRIDTVCKQENLSDWLELSQNIDRILKDYEIGGCKEDLGKKSHNAVINALRRFSEFLNFNE